MCNLRCGYCWASAQSVERDNETTVLQLEKAESLIEDILANSRSPKLRVIFVGGEPTMVPVAWYESLCARLSIKASERKKSISWSIQTNGQSIDHDWAALFRRHNMGVGVSIDGPPEIAARQRSGSEKAANAVRFLRANGIQVGSIVVGTSLNLPHIDRIHEYLGGLGVSCFHIVPVMPLGRAKTSESVPAASLLTAYIALIDGFLRNPNLPQEDRLSIFVRRFIQGDCRHLAETECFSGTKPCGKELIFLDSDGSLFPCSYATDKALTLGHAQCDGVSWSIPKTVLVTRVLAEEFALRCLACRAKTICGFSCAAVDFVNPAAREIECEFYQLLMQYFESNRRKIEQLYKILET